MKSLKICVTFVAEFLSASSVVLADKKITFGEMIGLVPQLAKVPKFITNLPIAIQEVKAGISDEYLAEIREEVKISLDIENDKIEAVVEEIVSWLIYTFSTVVKISKFRKK
jgi:hypothetical protein